MQKLRHILFALVLLALVAWLDLVTGPEISVFPLYILPLLWAVWHANLTIGLWLSLLAALVRRWIDYHEGHSYSNWWIFWEVGLASLTTYAFVVFSFHIFKRGRKIDHERIRRLEEMLPLCPACRRVRNHNGDWTGLEACLREPMPGPPECRLCPECAEAKPANLYSF